MCWQGFLNLNLSYETLYEKQNKIFKVKIKASRLQFKQQLVHRYLIYDITTTVLAPRIRFFYFNHWKVRSFALPAYYNVTRGSTSWLSIMKKNFVNLLRLNFNVVLYFYDFFLGGFPPNTSQKAIVALRYSHATVFHKNSLI